VGWDAAERHIAECSAQAVDLCGEWLGDEENDSESLTSHRARLPAERATTTEAADVGILRHPVAVLATR
jgi:hypothetical protein